jgi:hypothetical protein
MTRVLREILLWIPVGLIPLLNGTIRILGYSRWIAEPSASFVSSACDALAIGAYAFFAQRSWPATSRGAIARGSGWLALSTLNHFGLGCLAFGMSLSALAAKYDLLRSETWGLISLVILLAPVLARRLAPRARPSPGAAL